jgi:putative ABC transport system ATP-binding protein
MLCGLLKPSTGDIVIHGQSVSAMSHAQLDKYRGANIGVVFQRPHLIKALTVIENIQLAVYLSGKKVAKEKYDYVLDSLDLGQLKNRKVHELSEGQAQRVSIARAVIHDPVLLVADEPTASLDDANCERVLYLLKAQAEACKANLIIATHDQRIKGAFDNQLVL